MLQIGDGIGKNLGGGTWWNARPSQRTVAGVLVTAGFPGFARGFTEALASLQPVIGILLHPKRQFTSLPMLPQSLRER